MSDLICYSFLMFIETPCINFTRDHLFDALFRFALYGLFIYLTHCTLPVRLQCLYYQAYYSQGDVWRIRRFSWVSGVFWLCRFQQFPAELWGRDGREGSSYRSRKTWNLNATLSAHSQELMIWRHKIISKYPQYNRYIIQTSTRIYQTSANHTAYPFTGTSLSSVPSLYLTQRVACTKCIYLKSVAEFKEFERRFKFKPWLKYGWFHLKFYQMFQDLSRRLI